MQIGHGSPVSPQNSDRYVLPRSIIQREGQLSLTMRGVEHLHAARLPLEKKGMYDKVPTDAITVEAAGRVFVTTSEQYLKMHLLSASEYKKIIATEENPGERIGAIVTARMKLVAWKHLNMKAVARECFGTEPQWERKTYNTLCKIASHCNNWKQNYEEGSHVFQKKGCRTQYSVSSAVPERVYLHHNHTVGDGSGKVAKAGLEILSQSPIVRLKPNKKSDSLSQEEVMKFFQNELNICEALKYAKDNGIDMEGLLVPRDIVHYTKTKEGKEVERTNIMVDWMSNGDLRDYINKDKIKDSDVLRICYQIAKGLCTFQKVTGCALRDLKPDNVLVDKNGNVRISDYGFARSLQKRDFSSKGSAGYRPPEFIALLEDANNQNNPNYKSQSPKDIQGIDSGAWDAWTLGVVLYMVSRSPSRAYVPRLFSYQVKGQYKDFLDDVKRHGIRRDQINVSTLNGIIEGLLVVDPNERLTVWEALKALEALYTPAMDSPIPKTSTPDSATRPVIVKP